MREQWISKRKADPIRTQMHYARKGVVNGEMEYVARRERLAPELIRAEIARGSSSSSTGASQGSGSSKARSSLTARPSPSMAGRPPRS